MIQHLFLKIKHCYNRIIKFMSYVSFRYKRIKNVNTRQIVLFDTEGLTINRRLAQVVLQFYENNYDCRIRITLKDYLSTSAGDYSNIVFEHTRLIGKDHYELLVCGKNNSDHSCKRLVFNDTLVCFPDHIDSPFFYPLIFHPLKTVNHAEAHIDNLYLREKEKRIGIVFVGNTDVSSYKTFERIIHDEYGMLTRLDVLDFIRESFPDKVFEPRTREEFYSAYSDPNKPLKEKIVLIDRFRIGGSEYFDILYNSIYHIWTCGDAFPYCHNQIEGMACGCIPIYQLFYEKALYYGMDYSNSVVFNDLTELSATITHLIDNIDDSEIERLSKSIRQLYVDGFSIDGFNKKVSRFISCSASEEEYYIHPPIYKY